MITEVKSLGSDRLFRSPDFIVPAPGRFRQVLPQRFIQAVISPRARGLAINVNLNPDKACNFDCAYCAVDRSGPISGVRLDVDALANELRQMLTQIHSGKVREMSFARDLPDHLVQLRQVTLGGGGEPTVCPDFLEAVQAVIHVRALGQFPFFKLVLMTNASRLDLPAVRAGLKLFTARDEIWAKLEAGTQRYLERVNRPDCPLEKIMENILLIARQRPVIIQSLFPRLNREGPAPEEIECYARRLNDLRRAGAQIPLVQIYSAGRSSPQSSCGHLPLKTLAYIARTVRRVSGLPAEVF